MKPRFQLVEYSLTNGNHVDHIRGDVEHPLQTGEYVEVLWDDSSTSIHQIEVQKSILSPARLGGMVETPATFNFRAYIQIKHHDTVIEVPLGRRGIRVARINAKQHLREINDFLESGMKVFMLALLVFASFC